MKQLKTSTQITVLIVAALAGCAPQRNMDPYVPALKYTGTAGAAAAPIPQKQASATVGTNPLYRPTNYDNRARLNLVDGDMRPQGYEARRPVIDGVNEIAPDPTLRAGRE